MITKIVNRSLIRLMLACILLLFALPSCEWDSNEENFVDNERIDHDQVSIDLGVAPNEVILINYHDLLYFSLSAKNANVVSLRFFVEDEELNLVNIEEGYVRAILNKPYHEESNLKVVITYNDNSLIGQIAQEGSNDKEGVYTKEYNYRILFTLSNRLKVTQSLSEGKYMALSWTKPQNMNVEKYEIYGRSVGSPLLGTVDANDRYFVDKDFACGLNTYFIRAIMVDSKQPYFEQAFAANYTRIDPKDIKIENTSTTSHYDVSWINPNPYAIKYVLQINESSTPVATSTTQASLPRENFFPGSSNDKLRIYVLPLSENNSNFRQYIHIEVNLADPVLEKGAHFDFSSFDPQKMRLYALNFNGVYCYDVKQNMKLISSSSAPLIESTEATVVPTQSGQMILYSTNTLTIYSNDSFSKKLVQHKDVPAYKMAGDWLLLTTNEGVEAKTILYNTNTMTATNIPKIDSDKYSSMQPTPDGKHIIALNAQNKLLKLKLENNKLTEVKRLEKEPIEITFNPLNANEAIFSYWRGQNDVVDINTFTVKRSFEGYFRNIDPISGRLLLAADYQNYNSEFVVLDSNFAKEIKRFKVNNVGYKQAYIFNDIFVYRSYYGKY